MTHLEVATSLGEFLRTKSDLAEAAEENETERSAIDSIAAMAVFIFLTSALLKIEKHGTQICVSALRRRLYLVIL
jgi:hypothetical protein